MSSAYHPQMDGATERANRTVTQMLRQCISPNQKDWVGKLPTIQFAINLARSESTGYTPFFLNNGRMPRAMVWNSASLTEYSNVRELAQKKKLALISAYDSIIGARMKQTRDANRKRLLVPFKEGDFVYLSTKNITFTKGLARKLIPKFIGPYKIIQDFNNQSFKLELPVHLKRRGVHDTFHSSLLRIHVPNDDWLFPRRMDTQFGASPDTKDEWAVDTIKSHAGTGENTVFEILWKSGDVTWMPFYQIRHLQALETYLELMGVDSASKLVAEKGNPPQEDPQVFLGALSLSPSFLSPLQHSSSPVSFPRYNRSTPFPLHFLDINTPFYRSDSLFHIHSNSAQLSLNYNLYISIMLDGIRHPQFLRLTKTEYVVNNPEAWRRDIVHIRQISTYLTFDKLLRGNRTITNLTNVPIGYMDFATIFNTGKHPHDQCYLSTFISTPEGFSVTKSTNPVTLQDFYITVEQCGLVPPRDATADAQAYVFQEYATDMAMRTKRR